MNLQSLSGECSRRAVNHQDNDHYEELAQSDEDLRKDVGSCARLYSLGAISWKTLGALLKYDSRLSAR